MTDYNSEDSVNEGDSASSSELINGADSTNNTDKDLERMTLARKESIAVAWVKGVVFLVLLATTVLVSTGVYLYTKKDQEQNFEQAYMADATKVLESFHYAVVRKLEAVDALSVTFTSHAKSTGATFPNVTLPDFEIRCSNARVLSDSVVFNYSPLVTDETRKGWEAYQIENRDNTFDESFASEASHLKHQDIQFGHYDGRNLEEAPVVLRDEIANLGPDGSLSVAPDGSGPYLPVWQMSPVTPSKNILNFNTLSHPAASGAYTETIKSGQAVIEAAANLAGEHLGGTGAYFKLLLSMSQYRYDAGEFLGDPSSAFGYPVFDSFDLDRRKVVGLIATNFYWRLYFKNILPPNTRGIMCVLENTLGQTFTYRIDDTVAYLGIGDLHDSKYDHLEVSSEVASYIAERLSPETKSYTSVDLNSDYCSYTLRVYPSQDTEDKYVNRNPIIFTVVIVLVFLFTSLVFVLFTIAVARRQRVVMNRAVASSAIVSSLFPSQVRDQIYEENEAAKKKNNDWRMRDNSKESGVNAWMNDSAGGGDTVMGPSRPMADLFEHTTILFADLVGFTSWSSTRDPVQVFELLETIYQAFDSIAVRRKVFKVETIGDCYVAVTGLPEPQGDHALIMAKFARDCLAKMGELTAELAEVLGADTAKLTMRVGLHSGSVTGGVLRGQKSRFQLFGDAMNMASRMESNGLPGRIHISQETADELIAKGKSSWVTPREDKIVAKGKGELQTFWVSPRSLASSTGLSTYHPLEELAPSTVDSPSPTRQITICEEEEQKKAVTGESFEI